MSSRPEAPNRRRNFTDEELDALKEQLLESIYADIGRSFVKKALWIGGAVVSALFIGLTNADKFHLGK